MTDSAQTTTQVPVLIVGGGPAGLVAAITLARYGIRCLLIERREELADDPRATAISVRSMELLRSWGLEAEVRAGALDITFLARFGETLTGPGYTVPVGYPTPEEAAAVSPVAPVCAPQDHLEPVLLRHLSSLPGAGVRLGAELVDLAAGERGVLARVRDVRTGELETIAARYLVGADGIRSRVRDALGVRVDGPGVVAEGVSALFHAPLWERVERPGYVIYPIADSTGDGVFVPAGRGDRWIYGVAGDPGTLPAELFDEGPMAARIRAAAGIPDLEPRFARIKLFQYAANLAERFRVGSAFLTGDAAHRVTPRGGTGMNTAIQSGRDLGWKLGWVLKGWADEDLLDTYEGERRPVAEHNVARSVDPNGSLREAGEELRVDLGARIPHAWVERGSARRSTVDLVGPGFTLFRRRDAPPSIGGPVDARAPVSVRELPATAAAALGIRPGQSLLVRPDGVPVHAGAPSSPLAAEPTA